MPGCHRLGYRTVLRGGVTSANSDDNNNLSIPLATTERVRGADKNLADEDDLMTRIKHNPREDRDDRNEESVGTGKRYVRPKLSSLFANMRVARQR